MSRLQRSTRIGLTVLLCGGLTVAVGTLAFAKAPWSFRGSKAKQNETEKPEVVQSKLNYPFGTRWDKVLNHLAAEHGLTMVMSKVPRGNFKRFDRSEYDFEAAIGVLNEELHQQDFRLIRQGDFLVLMHLRSTRTRYRRPRLPQVEETAARSVRTTVPTSSPGVRAEAHTIRPRDWKAPEVSAPSAPTAAANSQIDRVAFEEPKVTELIKTPVTPNNRTALQLARRLYSAFLSHSELIDAGPDGLPAFRVMNQVIKSADGKPLSVSAGADPVARFSVGIDKKNNRLMIEAPKTTAAAIVRMIRMLDVPFENEQPDIKVRDSKKDANTVAKKIRPVVRKLTAVQPTHKTLSKSKPAAETNRDDFELAQAQPKAQPKAQPTDERPIPPRGNPPAKVMELIELLEAGEAATVPGLEPLMLKHVNSEALATLLTSVYETLNNARTQAGQRSQTVTVVPVVKPNAVLILAPDSDLRAIIDLAMELDQPVDPSTEFEIFRLKHAPASQVSAMLEDFYQEGQDRPGLSTRVVVYPDVRTNSIIVQARPRDLQEVAALVKKMDLDSASSVNQLRVFQLKHAIAEELSETINLAIQSVINPARQPTGAGVGGGFGGGVGGAQSAQQLRDVRSAVLELLPDVGTKDGKVVSGILSEIRINPDARTNSLVVTAPERSMVMMKRLIESLDKPTSVVADIKHFLLENADATSVSDLLAELFVTDDGGQGGQLGVQLAGAEDASSSIVPLRFSVDVRTNSIFAVGGREALEVVEAVVARLDQSDIRERKTEVYSLQNQPAADIANAVNTFLQSQRDLQQIDPDLVSPFEQIEREVIVVAEPSTNTLIVSATPRYYEEVMKMIETLDRPPEQVTVQALIVEVELNNTDEFGVELGFQDTVLFDRGTVASIETISETNQTAGNDQTITQNIVSSEGVPGFNFNQPFLGNNTLGSESFPASVGKQALNNFQMGRVNGDLGFGGLVLSAGSESINILLRALSENRRVEVLSRPMIQALHNQLGSIVVGQTFQQVNGLGAQNTLTGVSQPQLQERAVGIQLQVTPRVSPDGSITMEVVATKDGINPSRSIPIISDFQTGTTIDSPVIDTVTAQASVSVQDGQTIVLGGMITQSEGTIERKVPWLADLPVLGTAFRFDSKSKTRSELLIFLTPRIMKTPEDYEEQKQVEAERMAFSMEKAEEINGPVMSLPEPESEKKTNEKPEAKGSQPKPMSRKKAPPATKKPEKKTDPGQKKTGQLEDDDISRASMTTVGSDDLDTKNFALPNEIDGFEESVPTPPATMSPVKRFFKALVP